MSNHEKTKKNEVNDEIEEIVDADSCESAEKNVSSEEIVEKIDVDKLSESDARLMLKEVLETNDELIKEYEKLKIESEKHKDNWYRTTAEFENFKKRNNETRRNAYDEGKTDAIKGVLVIGDSLDRALSMQMDEKTKSGVELVKRQFIETLGALGIEEIDPSGKEFSPDEAEAIASVDPLEGEQSGTIRSVFKKGFKLNGKIIRYAQVVVVK